MTGDNAIIRRTLARHCLIRLIRHRGDMLAGNQRGATCGGVTFTGDGAAVQNKSGVTGGDCICTMPLDRARDFIADTGKASAIFAAHVMEASVTLPPCDVESPTLMSARAIFVLLLHGLCLILKMAFGKHHTGVATSVTLQTPVYLSNISHYLAYPGPAPCFTARFNKKARWAHPLCPRLSKRHWRWPYCQNGWRKIIQNTRGRE